MARRRDVDRLTGEIDDLFAELWQVPRFAGRRFAFRPAVDCYHSPDPHRLTVVVELAGIDPTEVQIIVSGRTLVISGERRKPRDSQRVYQQMELDYGPFRREIALAAEVDSTEATATYRNGMLEITLPIAERPRRQVKVPIDVKPDR
jgi:HSP20 family protein